MTVSVVPSVTTTHSPRWLQSGEPGQSVREQSAPRQPSAHKHWPDVRLHDPRPEHSFPPRPAHTEFRTEQSRSGPSAQPARHWQWGTPESAAVHTPLSGLVQLLLHTGTEQSLGWPAGPVQLASHRQKGCDPVLLIQRPLLLHAGWPGQSGISQAKPAQPAGHTQRGGVKVLLHVPRPLHSGTPGQ